MPDLLRRRIAASMAILAAAPTASWAAAPFGNAVIDVRRHGARGNGVVNDTRAFQAAIDALPPAGGTVQVPGGDYLIDPVVGVKLRSRMHLAMSPGTRLIAKPNAAERAYVLNAHRVSDVVISGGRIIGERSSHKGTTGEWGHGLMIRASERVQVRDMHISHCWGDGISIGGAKVGATVVPSRDLTIERVVCADNRRQGLTIGRSRRVRVFDSEFIDTGGTLPGAGIDVEPDQGDIADDILVARCTVRGNEGPGIQLYKRVTDATVRDCLVERNRGHGILTVGATDCRIEANRIRENVLGGVGVRPGTRGLVISRNEFDDNGRSAKAIASGAGRGGKRHVVIGEKTERISVESDNRYLD
ncbi:hypothetical protein GOY17_11615 [Lysobacter soli]|nr:hypothetical protein GOY17_11615 [Lysobacter soli]